MAQILGSLLLMIFIMCWSKDLQASAPACRSLFLSQVLRQDHQILQKAFQSSTPRILHVTPDLKWSSEFFARFLKDRLAAQEFPVLSLVILETADLSVWDTLRLEKEGVWDVYDLSNPRKAAPFFATDEPPRTHQVIVAKAENARAFLQELMNQEAFALRLDGIYIEEKPAVWKTFPKKDLFLPRVLSQTGAVRYGLVSGSPTALKDLFAIYDRAFARGELLDFANLSDRHTRFFSLEWSQHLAAQDGVTNPQDLQQWIRPPGVPLYLKRVYGVSAHEFLKQPRAVKVKIRTFEDARDFVRQQEFALKKQYTQWPERPKDLPLNPAEAYAQKGWKGWADFLGNTRKMSYSEAQNAVFKMGIRNREEFMVWPNRPARMPNRPWDYYPEWPSDREFFGNPKLRISPNKIRRRDYESAFALVKTMGFKSIKDYQSCPELDRLNLPYDPHRYYKGKGWVDWPTFLGLKQ